MRLDLVEWPQFKIGLLVLVARAQIGGGGGRLERQRGCNERERAETKGQTDNNGETSHACVDHGK